MAEQTNNIIRNILAVVAGVLAGVIAIFAVQAIGHQVYPPPANLDPADQEAMRLFIKSLPAGALLFVLASYALGSLVAGALAAYLGRGARFRHALVAGGVLLLAGVMNLLAMPHPLWFSVSSVLVFLPAAWLGARAVVGAGEGGTRSTLQGD